MSILAAIGGGCTKAFRFWMLAFLCVVMAVGIVPVAGCAGTKTREHVAVPALSGHRAEGVREDALAGLQSMGETQLQHSELAISKFFAAVAGGDVQGIIAARETYWPEVRAAAEAGIARQLDEKQIGPKGAEILHKRLKEYGDVLDKLSR